MAGIGRIVLNREIFGEKPDRRYRLQMGIESQTKLAGLGGVGRFEDRIFFDYLNYLFKT